ncbi:diacylglycerol kinase 7 [Tanacetum coccineum]
MGKELKVDGPLPDKVSCCQGVFYNYFSIGMDAQVAYGFYHLRNNKPYLAQGPISNKNGFVEARADDGVLEVFGFKHGWHASFVMVELISAKHIAQVPWTNERPLENRELNAIIGAWFTLWRD